MIFRQGTLCLAGLCFATMLFPHHLLATEVPSLENLGLGAIEPLDDEAGMQVRGLSASAGYSGFSMVSGMLVDPNSGSVLRGQAINSRGSYSQASGSDASAAGEGSVGFDLGWAVNDLSGYMSALAYGMGLSVTRLR
jgi:hypothetical protein